jgi:glycosyltransferase involved in cell wall biosynthesis
MDAAADLSAGAAPVTALVPCFNEGPQVGVVYRAIDEALSARYPDLEILFVDDGSTDDTLDHIKRLADHDPRVRYLSFGRNFGLEAAFSAGFRYAGGPWIAQLDADLQSPPAEVPRLLAAARGYDVVYGIRRNRDDPVLRRLGSTVQQWLARRLFGVALVPGASTFRVVRADVARRAVALRLATPYFIATLPLLGARATTVDVDHARRTAGRSRWRPWRLVAHSFELFFGFSVRPLVWLYAAVVPTTAVLLGAAVTGRTAGAAAPLLLAGQALLLLAVAVVAAYLHRVVRGGARPALFYIREANIPVAPEDSLYGEPPAVRVEEVAWPRPS